VTIKLSRNAHPITASNRRESVEETKLECQFALCNTQDYKAGIASAAFVQERGADGYAWKQTKQIERLTYLESRNTL